MFRKSIIYKLFIIVILTLIPFVATAQKPIDCEKTAHFIPDLEKRISKINVTDPEVISLHCLFVQDMIDEMEDFRKNSFPNLHFCDEIDYYPTIRRCDTLETALLKLKETLEIQKKRVDTLFYMKAVEELELFDTSVSDYYLDRSLQFNPLNTDALILKAKLLFYAEKYDECIQEIHILYNKAPLQRHHENELSDFTAVFYDHLFTRGDSLIKNGHAAEALPVFQTLESFCHNMPSAYCNDDYYHGIIRSTSGIYESYLTIAQVAWKRKNYVLAYKFLDYAYDYRRANEGRVKDSETFRSFIDEMERRRSEFNFNPDMEEAPTGTDGQATEELAVKEGFTDSIQQPSAQITPVAPAIDTARQLIYENLMVDALYNLLNNHFEQARQCLIDAMNMEKSERIHKDTRLPLLYEEFFNKSKKHKNRK